MNDFKEFLRRNNFCARLFTVIAILFSFVIFTYLGKSMLGEKALNGLRYFGAVGILVGSYIAHQLYYRWIFPEKNRSTK